MARTYSELCTDALITANVIDPAQTPESSEITLALRRFNSWAATLYIDKIIPPFNTAQTINTLGDGTFQFGPGSVNPTVPMAIRMVSVYDVSKQINLIPKDIAEKPFYNASNSNHDYYFFETDSFSISKLTTCPTSKELIITYSGDWIDKTLNMTFDLPAYYYSILEYGLAALLSSDYTTGKSVELATIYEGRIDKLTNLNYVASTLKTGSGNGDSYINGWGM